jgi:hypothetical protein
VLVLYLSTIVQRFRFRSVELVENLEHPLDETSLVDTDYCATQTQEGHPFPNVPHSGCQCISLGELRRRRRSHFSRLTSLVGTWPTSEDPVVERMAAQERPTDFCLAFHLSDIEQDIERFRGADSTAGEKQKWKPLDVMHIATDLRVIGIHLS